MPQPPRSQPLQNRVQAVSSDSQKVGKGSLNIYDALKCRLVGLTVFRRERLVTLDGYTTPLGYI